ncbi:MAG: F0F1 ATP synthase subunit B [Bacteroidales bacterium]|nr:F0F1 ATP synthase subunit B [Bacteroidales bacterium]
MELVQPHIGTFIWMLISFSIVLFILGKFAWPAILKSLDEREQSIEEALRAAEKAREDIQAMQHDNEKLLKQAKEERDDILREARKIKDDIIQQSKEIAVTERERILAAAREDIHNEKMAVITDLKNQMAQISIDIAEKVLNEELSKSNKQKELINRLVDDAKLN